VLLFVLLFGAGLLLVMLFMTLWRIQAFDPWLNAKFPRIYPALIGLMSLAIALKLTFLPSSRDIERGFRWLWVPLLLIGSGVLLGKALGWP